MDNYAFDELERIVKSLFPDLRVNVTLRGDDVIEFMQRNRTGTSDVLISFTGFDADPERLVDGQLTGEVEYPETYTIYFRGRTQRGDPTAAYRELIALRDAIQFMPWKSDDDLTQRDRCFIVEGGTSLSDPDNRTDCFTIHIKTTTY